MYKKAGNWSTLTDRCAVNLLEHLIFDHGLMINFWCFYSPETFVKDRRLHFSCLNQKLQTAR